MKMLKIATALIFLFSTLWWTPAFAYSGREIMGMHERAAVESGYGMDRGFRASEFIGEKVKNARGETLGRVNDFVFDRDGRIEYVVLAHRRGFTENLIPVPYDIVRFTPTARLFVVDVSRESLFNAPSFRRDEWKEFENPEWTKRVHSYYESEYRMRTRPEERPMRMEHQGTEMEHKGMMSPQTEQRSGYGY